jgi:hypothetical protein
MYSFVGAGNVGSSSMRQAASSTIIMNPCFVSFYKWLCVIVEGVQSCSSMAQGGRRSNTPELWYSPLFAFFSLSFPLSVPLSFSDVGKEVRRNGEFYERMQGCARVTASFNNSVVS